MSTYKEGKVLFLNYPKFDLFAETPDHPGKRSRMAFGTRDGNPRITVFTNVPSDNVNKGVIYAPFTPDVFLSFLDLFEKAIKNGLDTKYKIDCKTYARTSDGKTDFENKVVTSQLWFGKDKNGICWICVTAENRPRIPFKFKMSDFHTFHHGDGRPFTEAEGSDIVAMSTVIGLRQIITNMVGEYTKSFEQDAPVRTKGGAKTSAPAGSNAFEEDVLF